jgi:hypothetical protein
MCLWMTASLLCVMLSRKRHAQQEAEQQHSVFLQAAESPSMPTISSSSAGMHLPLVHCAESVCTQSNFDTCGTGMLAGAWPE